jgi:hypothetical protein
MRKSPQSPQEVRVEEKGLLAEDQGMEHPDRGIGGDINLWTALGEAEVVQEKQEAMPAMVRVEMEGKEFSLTSPVWTLGTAAVEPVDRGTEPVAPAEWAAEETEEVETQLRGRMG